MGLHDVDFWEGYHSGGTWSFVVELGEQIR